MVFDWFCVTLHSRCDIRGIVCACKNTNKFVDFERAIQIASGGLLTQKVKSLLGMKSGAFSLITIIWNFFEPRSISMEKLMSSLSDSLLGASVQLSQMAL